MRREVSEVSGSQWLQHCLVLACVSFYQEKMVVLAADVFGKWCVSPCVSHSVYLECHVVLSSSICRPTKADIQESSTMQGNDM